MHVGRIRGGSRVKSTQDSEVLRLHLHLTPRALRRMELKALRLGLKIKGMTPCEIFHGLLSREIEISQAKPEGNSRVIRRRHGIKRMRYSVPFTARKGGIEA